MTVVVLHKHKNSPSVLVPLLVEQRFVVCEVVVEDWPEFAFPTTLGAVVFESLYGEHLTEDRGIVESVLAVTEAPLLLVTKQDADPLYRSELVNAGVDVCLVAPFLPEELELRLKKLMMQRRERQYLGVIVQVGDISLNVYLREVTRLGQKISLTKIEYYLLEHLFLAKNTLVSGVELGRYLGENAHSLPVHISNLRQKLGVATVIKTLPNYGYMVVE